MVDRIAKWKWNWAVNIARRRVVVTQNKAITEWCGTNATSVKEPYFIKI